MTSSGPVSVNSRPKRPIWLRSARIGMPTPQRSANFVSVGRARRTGETDDDGKVDAARPELADPAEDRRAFEAELRHDIDADAGLAPPVAPGFESLEGALRREIRMAFGMTGNARCATPCASSNPLFANVETRPVRAFRGDDVAGDQEHAPDIGLAPQPRQKIRERLARGHSRARYGHGW